MLKEFSIKNYLSFKNEVVFSMEADVQSVSEHDSHIIKIGTENILKVASIYGPNGSGKSNLLKSINYFKNIIIHGLKDDNIDVDAVNYYRTINSFDKFDFCDNNNDSIDFSAYFINDDCEIGYEIQIAKIGASIIIKTENMSYRNINSDEFISIYERNHSKIALSSKLQKLLINQKILVSDQKTLIAFINEFFIKNSEENSGIFKVLKIFMDEINNIGFIRPSRSHVVYSRVLPHLYEDENIKNKALSLLNNLGINVSDIFIDKSDEQRGKLSLIRNIEGENYKLDFEKESDGTRQLLYLLPTIIKKIENGGIFIIDEIDAHLHPKLTKAVIQIFTNKLNSKSQLIFTSHDILNMTNDLFRRDEIWYVVKDDHQASRLIALTDFVNYKGEKIRKDAKYSKQYLEGKYGADPFIQKGVYWDAKNS